jgi:hypothetical protein
MAKERDKGRNVGDFRSVEICIVRVSDSCSSLRRSLMVLYVGLDADLETACRIS